MKHTRFPLIVMFFIMLLATSVYGSTPQKEVFDTATVKQQLEYVLKKSTTYEEYKVIKIVWVNKLKSSILDSLKQSKQAFKLSQKEVGNKQNTIDSLSYTLAETEAKFADVIKEKNSVRFLGFLISKSTYNGVITGIISILSILLAAVLYLFKRSITITNRTKLDLAEIKEEFETHRTNSREREEKIARRHLDEILKYKNQKHASQFTVK